MADPVIISGDGGGGGRGLETILIIAALALGAWFIFTRLKKDPAPIKREEPAPPAKPPSIADEGKLRIDSQVLANLNSGRTGGECGPGMQRAKSGQCVSTYVPPGWGGKTPAVDISSSPLSLAMAPAQTGSLMPVAQALVIDRPAPVQAPVGAVLSTQPAPPQSSKAVATSMLSSAGRPAPVVIAPLVQPKPAPPPAAPKPVIMTTAVAKPAVAAFVKPLPSLSTSSAVGFKRV